MTSLFLSICTMLLALLVLLPVVLATLLLLREGIYLCRVAIGGKKADEEIAPDIYGGTFY